MFSALFAYKALGYGMFFIAFYIQYLSIAICCYHKAAAVKTIQGARSYVLMNGHQLLPQSKIMCILYHKKKPHNNVQLRHN
jgi:hypothetical protein